MRAACLANDWQALLALQTAFIEWPAFEEALTQVTMPCLLIAAEGDRFYAIARESARAIPHARFESLPAGRHGQDSYPPELVVPHMRALLASAA